jgi:YD repeat-containing protein
MNKKYERYIEYIVNDIEKPYFINMRDQYGLSEKEYELVIDKVFNQPIRINGDYVYDTKGNRIYIENSDGYWVKYEFDNNGNLIYYETSNGDWYKYKYDTNGKVIYYENSSGLWYKREYDANGKLIYREDSNGYIIDNR